MKLIKLNTDQYIIVDDSEIKEGDFVYDSKDKVIRFVKRYLKDNWIKKITHSTEPLNKSLFFTDRVWGCERLSLGEVKELIGEVDVEKMIEVEFNKFQKENPIIPNSYFNPFKLGVLKGYNQALEDNKEKKYTEEDIRDVVCLALEDAEKSVIWSKEWYPNKLADKIIQSLQPKTEWEVEFIDGKLKLKQ